MLKFFSIPKTPQNKPSSVTINSPTLQCDVIEGIISMLLLPVSPKSIWMAFKIIWIFPPKIFMKLNQSQRQWLPTGCEGPWHCLQPLTLQIQVFLQASKKSKLRHSLQHWTHPVLLKDLGTTGLWTRTLTVKIFMFSITDRDYLKITPCQHNRMTLACLNAGQIFNTASHYFQNFRAYCRCQQKALLILLKIGTPCPCHLFNRSIRFYTV